MALLPFPLNSLVDSLPACSCSSSSHSYFALLLSRNHSSKTCKFRICCSHGTIRVGNQQFASVGAALEVTRQKRQTRPSFLEQVRDKWPLKPDSEQEGEGEAESSYGALEHGSGIGADELLTDHRVHGSKPRKPHFGSGKGTSVRSGENVVDVVEESGERCVPDENDGKFRKKVVSIVAMSIGSSGNEDTAMVEDVKMVSLEGASDGNRFPADLSWRREGGVGSMSDGDRKRWRNIELAERKLPELELRRLRNLALRMLERTKVAGITQALVDSIHQKWMVDEVVKLTFEEPFSLNMKRTHEILESKTGGLVIWRSGSSIVLYRGIGYKTPRVQIQSDTEHSSASISRHSTDVAHGVTENMRANNSSGAKETYNPDSEVYLKDLAKEELMDLTELNHLLDELGPRFRDWSGRDPLPVDADRFPSMVPEYKPPLRVIPYGRRHTLKHKEITKYQRLSKTMPPHFVLGRNRGLEGLAKAMVKLWEKNAIAKIAIKRGVQNTCNERMAEELKKLTGGIILVRNKDYMVFYRGNDFLPPAVTVALKERRKLAEVRQDEEELARQMTSASLVSNAKTSKGPLVAGTLAETMAAISRWGSQPSNEDVENMMKESVLTKQASLVRYLEKKLAAAKAKAKKADKALAKVQKYLEPAELPTDSETLTDEERFLFRKMGMSMKPFLLIGRRGVYNGTIENMHLHWKYRELVKIIVRRKRLAQAKQVAITLEAESGGVLVSMDKTVEGHAIIVYRGKNYSRPTEMRPKNLLTKRQAFARSIELQRREALKHHISGVQEKIELLSLELEEIRKGKIDIKKSLYSQLDDPNPSDADMEEVGSCKEHGDS